jgi:hypothetical protein
MHKLLILEKDKESLLARHETNIKSCSVFINIMDLRNCSYFRFFYEGLKQSSKQITDSVAGGNLMNMDVRDAYKLIDEMALRQQQ